MIVCSISLSRDVLNERLPGRKNDASDLSSSEMHSPLSDASPLCVYIDSDIDIDIVGRSYVYVRYNNEFCINYENSYPMSEDCL